MKKQKNKKQSTMTFHLWRDFAMFAVIIMVVLWLLQVIFLNTFYESMKKKEIQKIGNEMVTLYNEDSEEFYSYLERNAFKNGVFAHVLSKDGAIIKSPQPMEEFQHRPTEKPIPKHIKNNKHIRDNYCIDWIKIDGCILNSPCSTCPFSFLNKGDKK